MAQKQRFKAIAYKIAIYNMQKKNFRLDTNPIEK